MIELNDCPLGLTDELLIDTVTRWSGEWDDEPARFAALLLTAPPEYRLGVEDRADRLGKSMSEAKALRQALDELAAQGVTLLPWPR
jgi:hypothetical protein